jgi:hypothetical protein
MAEEGGLDRLAEEWIGLWQEEIAALVADADMMAAWRLMLGGWMGGMAHEAGTPAAAAASRPAGDAAVAGDGGASAGLLERVAALEARLAALEVKGDAGGGAPRRPARGKRPPA